MYDPTLKLIVDDFEEYWLPFILNRLGLPSNTPAKALDTNLPSVAIEADRIYRLETDPPFLLHLEFESSRPTGRPVRFLKYNVLASDREGVPTRTVVILLRPESLTSDLTGELIRDVPGKPGALVFRYDVIRIWEIPPEVFLAAGPGLWPLAPLGNLADERVPSLMMELKEKWKTIPQELAIDVASATEVLMGLRFSNEFVQQVIQRIETMEESTVYQAIFRKGEERGILEGKEEGRQEGRQEGKIEMAQIIIRDVLTSRFGAISESLDQAISAIHDLAQLQRMMKGMNTVDRPESILDLR